jgi:transcriptional antiterminator RfaH
MKRANHGAGSISAQALSGSSHMESFWCAARLRPQHENYALHCLGVSGFAVYFPKLRQSRTVRGRRVKVSPPLFPGYAFVWIELQWHAARWSPGILGLIMDGAAPARVPDRIIAEIRGRERNGLIELPKAPGLRRGDRVRITAGPFTDHLALYQGQAPHERVEVLLALLGGSQRVTLPESDVEPCRG